MLVQMPWLHLIRRICRTRWRTSLRTTSLWPPSPNSCTLSLVTDTFWCLIYGSIYLCVCFYNHCFAHWTLIITWWYILDRCFCCAPPMFLPEVACTVELWVGSPLISFRDGLANDVTTSHSFLSWQNVYLYSFWTSFFSCFFPKDSTSLDICVFSLLFRSSSTLLLMGVRSSTRIATLFGHVQWSIDPFKETTFLSSRSISLARGARARTAFYCNVLL